MTKPTNGQQSNWDDCIKSNPLQDLLQAKQRLENAAKRSITYEPITREHLQALANAYRQSKPLSHASFLNQSPS